MKKGGEARKEKADPCLPTGRPHRHPRRTRLGFLRRLSAGGM